LIKVSYRGTSVKSNIATSIAEWEATLPVV